MSKKLFPKILAVLLSVCMVLSFTGCGTDPKSADNTVSQEVQNLEKLCKVWGYTKYRHPAFYNGEKDWDEELLNLIPQVRELKTEKEVNKLLCDWFESLGELGNIAGRNRDSWKKKIADSESISIQANLDWSKDVDYLGKDLVFALSQIEVLPQITKQNTPPVAIEHANITFNEKTYPDFDYTNQSNRLLGLFRVWNTVEYYFPYHDIMDEDWHDLLPDYIEQILSENDRQSYELTLLSLVTNLRDAHVAIKDMDCFSQKFGEHNPPIVIDFAEGKVLVKEVLTEDCPLKPGDIIVEYEGKTIEEVIEEKKKYCSTTMDDKLKATMSFGLLVSKNPQMQIVVLRDGEKQEFTIQEYKNTDELYMRTYPDLSDLPSSEILEGNIGLINPQTLEDNTVDDVMESLKDTDGLIIDMRQYPSYNAAFQLLNHIIKSGETKRAAFVANPIKIYPGAFEFNECLSKTTMQDYHGSYSEKPIVVMIDETTWSLSEFMTMYYRTADNVTVLGENTIGSDGDRMKVTLPDENALFFTGFGIYGPNKEQVQRVGVAPDIEVKPTIEGIKEGRDELKEAAITYLSEQK